MSKKNTYTIVIWFVCIIILSSCVDDTRPAVSKNESIIDEQGFKIALHSEKTTYEYGEPINIWGEYTYLGDKNETVIIKCPGGPMMVYFIPKKKYKNMLFDDVAWMTTAIYDNVEKDKVYKEQMSKNGFYDCDFRDLTPQWQAYFNSKDKILLPEGKYLIKAYFKASICDDNGTAIYDYDISCELEVRVK